MCRHMVIVLVRYCIVLAQNRPHHGSDVLKHSNNNIQPTYSRHTPFQDEESLPPPALGIAHLYPYDALSKDITAKSRQNVPSVKSKFPGERILNSEDKSEETEYYYNFPNQDSRLNSDSHKENKSRQRIHPQFYEVREFSKGDDRPCPFSLSRQGVKQSPYHKPLMTGDNEENHEHEFHEKPRQWENSKRLPTSEENIVKCRLLHQPSQTSKDSHDFEHRASSSFVRKNENKRPDGIVGMVERPDSNAYGYNNILGMNMHTGRENPVESWNKLREHQSTIMSSAFPNEETTTTFNREPKKQTGLANHSRKYTTRNEDNGRYQMRDNHQRVGPFNRYSIRMPTDQKRIDSEVHSPLTTSDLQAQRSRGRNHLCESQDDHSSDRHSIDQLDIDSHRNFEEQNEKGYGDTVLDRSMVKPFKEIEAKEVQGVNADRLDKSDMSSYSRKFSNKKEVTVANNVVGLNTHYSSGTTDCREKRSTNIAKNCTAPSERQIGEGIGMNMMGNLDKSTTSPIKSTQNLTEEAFEILRSIKNHEHFGRKSDEQLRHHASAMNIKKLTSIPHPPSISPPPTAENEIIETK